MDYQKIIDTYYSAEENPRLREILMVHSRNVAELAVKIADRHPELSIDKTFAYEAAMLHDIGICMCDAQGIECYGSKPYICHGQMGAALLRQYAATHGIAEEGMERYARVCERHTGSGLTAEEIAAQNLPLPNIDLLPETLEEKLICYADKFFSKTRPEEFKSNERVVRSMVKFGRASMDRFTALHELFG